MDSNSTGYGQDSWNDYANEVGPWNRGGGNQMQSHPPPLMPGLKGQGAPRRMGGMGMGDYPVLMRGLPWSATEGDIRHFFAPLPLRGVQIIFDDTNRPSGK